MSSKLTFTKTLSRISGSIAFAMLLFGTFHATGQVAKWRDMGKNRNADFYQVQRDFNQYWQGKKAGKGVGYKVFKRWEAFVAPRVYPSGNMALTSATYSNFLSWQRNNPNNAARTNSTLATGNWTTLGPIAKPSGYDAGDGLVKFVRFDPNNTNILYVGTPDGGLWKSTNGGSSWTTNTDFLPIIGVSDLAIDPTNTQIMYLATGNFDGGGKKSIGILKSIDGGASWNPTGLTWTVADNYVITKILMHPANPLIMMISTDGGIFRTTDGWASFSNPLCCNRIDDIQFKPAEPNTIYAAGKEFYRSTDNGLNWTPITAGFPAAASISRTALGVSPANSAVVYAVVGNNNGGYLGMYRSANSGTSFVLQSSSPNILNAAKSPQPTDLSGQAEHDLAIAVSPVNANQVTVGGISQWRSNDAGVNWTLLSYWLGTDVNYPGEGDGPPDYVHADVQSIQYQPNSSTIMFTTCDGGISKSTNNGANWTDISNNLGIAQQTGVALSANSASLFVTGLQDIGTLKANAGAFSVINGGDGESAFIDRTNNLNIVTSNPNGNHALSTDGGITKNDITGLPAGTEFFSPIIQDPITATTVYAGGRAALYRSTDFTSTWTQLGTPAGTGGIIRFEIAPSNNTVIYALKYDAISRSVNSGSTWTNVNNTLPIASAALTNLAISNTDPNKVWVTFSGYSSGNKVFKTVNGGATWTNISSGLPNIPFNTIVYKNGSATDEVYSGADVGVFYNDNTSASWSPFFTGLPNTTVTDLEIFYPTGKLRAATYGRGTWESDLNTPAVNYTITASAGANGTIAPTGMVTVPSGGSQTFIITANTCYQVADVLVDGVSVGSVGSYTFTNVTATHTIAASFSLRTYAITATTGANGMVTPAGVTTVNCGSNQTYMITANVGYAIQNVVVDGVSVGAVATYTFSNVTATHTISATFTQTFSIINASAGPNGTIAPSGMVNVPSGANQTFTITPNTCYQVANVLVDGVSVGAVGTYTFNNVTTNHTISASFSLRTYAITATTGANGTVTPSGVTTVNCGSNQTYMITANSGYAIQNVVVDGVSVGAVATYTFSNVTATHTISATFTQSFSIINASAGPNGTIAPSGMVNVPNGGSQTFNISANACYQVANVLVDGVSVGGVGTYTFNNVTTNHTISASFSLRTYAITATTGANGMVTPAGVTTVNCGSNQTYMITANSGYAIQNVVVDGVSVGAVATYTFSNVTATHTISATFTQSFSIINASAGPNGTIAPSGPVNVPSGANQTFTITPNTCYQVANVLVDGVSVGAVGTYTFNNVTTNHTISASFSLRTYAITATTGANGTVTPVGTTNVNCGAGITYTIMPNGGFTVQNVTVDGASVGAVGTYTFTNVTATHTISATFIASVTTTAYRINSGGPQVTNSIGVFAADNYFSPTPGFTNSTAAGIAGTTDDAIYQTERYSTTGLLNYAFPVASGQYRVILHFAEIYLTGMNQRIFDVSIEANKVLDNYDILKKVAPNTATTETFTTNVTDGTLNILFSSLAADGGSNSPKVSAIEIIQTSTNLAPVANAGPDQTITLPTNSTTLSGSGTDASGGTIMGYSWSQISGPNNAAFNSTTIAAPTITGLIAGSYWFNLVVTDNQMATSAPDMVLITVNPAGNTPFYRINAGGPQVTNSIGVFAADQYFSPAPGNTYSTTAAIAGTTDDAIYQTERYSTTGVLNYAFPIANGQYRVILHFAEIYLTGMNQRIFDVSIEANKVLDNYDILKKVAPNTATTETFTTNVTDGTLNILFSSLGADGGSNSPKVSAIEIIQTSTNLAPVANAGPDQTITLPTNSTTLSGSGTDASGGTIMGYSWSQASGPNNAAFNSTTIATPTISGLIAGSYWFNLVVTDNQMATSPPDMVLITVNPAGSTPVYRINAGGPQVTNSIGVFAADQYFSPTPGNINSTTAAIAGTTDDAIYQTERFSFTGLLNYAFPVTNGQYTVVLHFAEIHFTGQNSRIFDVSIENNRVLDNYDILKKVAPNTATKESFTVNVTDGTLNILFNSQAADGGANNPKISAIEIIKTGAAAQAPLEVIAKMPLTATSLTKAAAEQKLSVTVSPNPAYNYFTFRIKSGNNKTVYLRIFSADGKLIESRSNTTHNATIDIGRKYIPGLYYAQVLQGKEMVTLKFIKLKY